MVTGEGDNLAVILDGLPSFAADLVHQAKAGVTVMVWTYYNFGPFPTISEYRAWLDVARANPDRLYHAIRDNAQGQAVGVAVYQNWVPAMGTIEIGGLVFSPRLQRRPAATEARMWLRTMIEPQARSLTFLRRWLIYARYARRSAYKVSARVRSTSVRVGITSLY